MDQFYERIKGFFSTISDSLIVDVLFTVLLFIGLILLKALLVRVFSSSKRLPFEVRKRRGINIRNLMILVFLIGVIFIWSKELHSLALTFVAVAFAIAFSFKEVISCANWEIFRAGTDAYSVGDYIEVEGIRGAVIDHNFLTTTIQELGPGSRSNRFSGRLISIPNSVFLNSPMINESYMKEYVLHSLTVPLSSTEDWERAEEILLEAALSESADCIEGARRHFEAFEHKLKLDVSVVEPVVSIELPQPEIINLVLRFPAPSAKRWSREQAILKRFLRNFRSKSASSE